MHGETCTLLITGCTLFRWLHKHIYNCLQFSLGFDLVFDSFDCDHTKREMLKVMKVMSRLTFC